MDTFDYQLVRCADRYCTEEEVTRRLNEAGRKGFRVIRELSVNQVSYLVMERRQEFYQGDGD